MFTVKELMNELSKYDENLKVGLYCESSEDMDIASRLVVEVKGKESLYCKGDHIFRWLDDVEELLIIT